VMAEAALGECYDGKKTAEFVAELHGDMSWKRQQRSQGKLGVGGIGGGVGEMSGKV